MLYLVENKANRCSKVCKWVEPTKISGTQVGSMHGYRADKNWLGLAQPVNNLITKVSLWIFLQRIFFLRTGENLHFNRLGEVIMPSQIKMWILGPPFLNPYLQSNPTHWNGKQGEIFGYPNHGKYVINYNMMLVVEKKKSTTLIIRSYHFLINSWYLVAGALMIHWSYKRG